MSNDEFRHALKQRILRAYEESGNRLGWRLLASPPSVLDGADVAFIGLNPAGSFQPVEHGELAMKQGSAYVDESWDGKPPGNSPLQQQVRALFAGLSVAPERVLAGNFVPFRSPNWKCLKNPEYSLKFGESLWSDILKRARPALVIGMGMGELRKPLGRIFGVTDDYSVPVGWGNITATKATFPGGSLVVLPHLSRFGIANRVESANALHELFGERWRGR